MCLCRTRFFRNILQTSDQERLVPGCIGQVVLPVKVSCSLLLGRGEGYFQTCQTCGSTCQCHLSPNRLNTVGVPVFVIFVFLNRLCMKSIRKKKIFVHDSAWFDLTWIYTTWPNLTWPDLTCPDLKIDLCWLHWLVLVMAAGWALPILPWRDDLTLLDLIWPGLTWIYLTWPDFKIGSYRIFPAMVMTAGWTCTPCQGAGPNLSAAVTFRSPCPINRSVSRSPFWKSGHCTWSVVKRL